MIIIIINNNNNVVLVTPSFEDKWMSCPGYPVLSSRAGNLEARLAGNPTFSYIFNWSIFPLSCVCYMCTTVLQETVMEENNKQATESLDVAPKLGNSHRPHSSHFLFLQLYIAMIVASNRRSNSFFSSSTSTMGRGWWKTCSGNLDFQIPPTWTMSTCFRRLILLKTWHFFHLFPIFNCPWCDPFTPIHPLGSMLIGSFPANLGQTKALPWRLLKITDSTVQFKDCKRKKSHLLKGWIKKKTSINVKFQSFR